MSSQTMLIIVISVAFLIVLLALLIEEPSAAEDGPVDSVDAGPAPRHVAVDVAPPLGTVADPDVTFETPTEPFLPWQPRHPDQGDTDDARRQAGLPPTPDR